MSVLPTPGDSLARESKTAGADGVAGDAVQLSERPHVLRADALSALQDELEEALLERDVARADAEAHAHAAQVVTEASNRRVDELQRRADDLEARLRAIETSRAWRLIARYRRTRDFIRRSS